MDPLNEGDMKCGERKLFCAVKGGVFLTGLIVVTAFLLILSPREGSGEETPGGAPRFYSGDRDAPGPRAMIRTPSHFRNEPGGFRDIPWGAEVSGIPGMELLRTSSDGNTKFYTRAGEDLWVWKAKLIRIVYEFWRDTFVGVIVEANGYGNWFFLRADCFSKYGAGYQEFRDVEAYLWEGERSRINLTYDRETEEAVLYMNATRFTDERELIR